MGDSLKDQLLALGLKPEKGVSKAKKKPAARPRKAQGKRSGDAELSLDQAYRMRNREEQQQKTQAARQKRELEKLRREINKKIRVMVNDHAVRDEKADIKRNFVYKGRIRTVLATREQLQQINEGSLGVVYLSGNYHLLPSGKVKEILKFAPDHIPDLSGSENEEEKEHPVPDDLIW